METIFVDLAIHSWRLWFERRAALLLLLSIVGLRLIHHLQQKKIEKIVIFLDLLYINSEWALCRARQHTNAISFKLATTASA